MKKYLLPSALILVLGLGLALAQNITKSVQLSQDPTGTIGYDIQGNVYFPGHILTTGVLGSPSVSQFSGTAPTITGTDYMATISGGGAATSTGIALFATAFLANPTCVLTSQNPGTSPIAYNAVTTGINITTNMFAAVINWVCSGKK